MSQLQIIVELLSLILVPVFACVVCVVVDTMMNFQYYRWNKQLHEKETQESENSPMVE